MTHEEAIRRIKDHMRVHRIGEYPHMMLAEALNMAIEAVEKQIPKAPNWIKYNISADLDPFPDIRYQCPVCYKSFKEEYDECPNCGQKLDWSE